MQTLKMSPRFSVDPDKINSNNNQAYNRADSTASTLFFYFRDSLNAPSGMMNKIKLSTTSKVGKVLRKECFCPEEIQNLPDSFFECLEESEKEYDFETIVKMWKSIGVSLKIEAKISKNRRATIMDVLNETMDIVLVPVIKPINARLEGFVVNSCLISNSGMNTKKPTISNFVTNETFKWGDIVMNSTWSCLSKETDKEKEKFDLKYRINKSSLTYNSQRSIQAIASSLSFAELDVWVCVKTLPSVRSYSSIFSTNADITEVESPSYRWVKFDHNNPINLSPIEPFIVRDFIENGDRLITLESITEKEDTHVINHPWEKDETYKAFM